MKGRHVARTEPRRFDFKVPDRGPTFLRLPLAIVKLEQATAVAKVQLSRLDLRTLRDRINEILGEAA